MAGRQTMPPLRVTVSDSGRAGELRGSLERDEDRKVPHEAVVSVSAYLQEWRAEKGRKWWSPH